MSVSLSVSLFISVCLCLYLRLCLCLCLWRSNYVCVCVYILFCLCFTLNLIVILAGPCHIFQVIDHVSNLPLTSTRTGHWLRSHVPIQNLPLWLPDRLQWVRSSLLSRGECTVNEKYYGNDIPAKRLLGIFWQQTVDSNLWVRLASGLKQLRVSMWLKLTANMER